MEYKDAMDAYIIIEEVLDLEKAIENLDEIGQPNYVEISGDRSNAFKSKSEELAAYIHKQTKLFLKNKIDEQKKLLTNIESNGESKERGDKESKVVA